MKKIVEDLAKDFKRWGIKETKLIRRGVNKWGVVFDSYENVAGVC